MLEPITQDWSKAITPEAVSDLLEFQRLTLSNRRNRYKGLKAVRNWAARCMFLDKNGKTIPHPADIREDEPLLPHSYTDYNRSIVLLSLGQQTQEAETEKTTPWNSDSWEMYMEEYVQLAIEELETMSLQAFLAYTKALYALGMYHPSTRVRAWWQQVYVVTVNKIGASEPRSFKA